MYIFKQTIKEPNRNATSIDDFYYRGTEYNDEGGTGVRGLAAKYFRERKIFDRQIILADDGNSIEITTIFFNIEYFYEFVQEPVYLEAMKFFKDRKLQVEASMYNVSDIISVRNIVTRGTFKFLHDVLETESVEEVQERISKLIKGTNK